MLIRRFFAFVISAFLIFFPAYSYANTSVGGWSAVDVITAGATNTINATKTAGGKALKSAVTVAPSAVKVGKHLIKGGGAAALALAVPQLIGEGVDWVLDPENNAVKYNIEGVAGDYIIGCPTVSCSINNYSFRAPVSGTAKEDVCAMLASSAGRSGNIEVRGSQCIVATYYSVGYVYPATFPPEDKPAYLPIEQVAAQVISNAEAGDPSSQEAVKATALEGFAAGEHDAALDSAATESDAGTENPPDTADPDNPPKPNEPAEPFDPAGIISAINALKALLAGILSSITSMADSLTGFFDWVQGDVPPEDEPKDVPFATTDDIGIDDNVRFEQRIEFNGQCPVNDFSFSMMGVTYSKPIPYYHLCGFLEQIAPWLLAMTYLGAAYFVTENL